MDEIKERFNEANILWYITSWLHRTKIYTDHMAYVSVTVDYYKGNIYYVKLEIRDNIMMKVHRWLTGFFSRLYGGDDYYLMPIDILVMDEFYRGKKIIEQECNVILELVS